VSAGVKVAKSVWLPATFISVPAAGEYTNVPATLDDASNCVEESAVPSATEAGAAQVIDGAACSTVIETLVDVDV
jgi:hypothetical protein